MIVYSLMIFIISLLISQCVSQANTFVPSSVPSQSPTLSLSPSLSFRPTRKRRPTLSPFVSPTVSPTSNIYTFNGTNFRYDTNCSNDGGGWVLVFENRNWKMEVITQKRVLNELLWTYGTGNMRYEIKRTGEIDFTPYSYYRRLTYPKSFNLYNNLAVMWSDYENKLNIDFAMYSTYNDLRINHSAWNVCNYNVDLVGYARDCGKTTLSSGQWTTYRNLSALIGSNTVIAQGTTRMWLQVTNSICNTSLYSSEPTILPTIEPSVEPASVEPSVEPSSVPSSAPTRKRRPTLPPVTYPPSIEPTLSIQPTVIPSAEPSSSPSDTPSYIPSVTNTSYPTSRPTRKRRPTVSPSYVPTATPTSNIYDFNGTYFQLDTNCSADGGGWVLIYANSNWTVNVFTQEAILNELFWTYGTGNMRYEIKRVPPSAAIINGTTQQQVIVTDYLPFSYYRRLTNPKSFNLYNNLAVMWSDYKNQLNIDFAMYSTYNDLLNNQSAWKVCNYNVDLVGYARDCGPTELSVDQWTTYRNLSVFVENNKIAQGTTRMWLQVNNTFCTTQTPTVQPTSIPSYLPTALPSVTPSYQPSTLPTVIPSQQPTSKPTIIPTSSPTKNPASQFYIYLGCYGDRVSARAMEKRFNNVDSVAACYTTASAAGYQYFALQYGGECRATNDYTSAVKYGACGPGCTGTTINCVCTKKCTNMLDDCGGADANALYQIGISLFPTTSPLIKPSLSPSYIPSKSPNFITYSPMVITTVTPTSVPLITQSPATTTAVSQSPTYKPSSKPSYIPSSAPSLSPTTTAPSISSLIEIVPGICPSPYNGIIPSNIAYATFNAYQKLNGTLTNFSYVTFQGAVVCALSGQYSPYQQTIVIQNVTQITNFTLQVNYTVTYAYPLSSPTVTPTTQPSVSPVTSSTFALLRQEQPQQPPQKTDSLIESSNANAHRFLITDDSPANMIFYYTNLTTQLTNVVISGNFSKALNYYCVNIVEDCTQGVFAVSKTSPTYSQPTLVGDILDFTPTVTPTNKPQSFFSTSNNCPSGSNVIQCNFVLVSTICSMLVVLCIFCICCFCCIDYYCLGKNRKGKDSNPDDTHEDWTGGGNNNHPHHHHQQHRNSDAVDIVHPLHSRNNRGNNNDNNNGRNSIDSDITYHSRAIHNERFEGEPPQSRSRTTSQQGRRRGSNSIQAERRMSHYINDQPLSPHNDDTEHFEEQNPSRGNSRVNSVTAAAQSYTHHSQLPPPPPVERRTSQSTMNLGDNDNNTNTISNTYFQKRNSMNNNINGGGSSNVYQSTSASNNPMYRSRYSQGTGTVAAASRRNSQVRRTSQTDIPLSTSSDSVAEL